MEWKQVGLQVLSFKEVACGLYFVFLNGNLGFFCLSGWLVWVFLWGFFFFFLPSWVFVVALRLSRWGN